MTDDLRHREHLEAIRAIAAWVESSSPPGPDTNRELAALDYAVRCITEAEARERRALRYGYLKGSGIDLVEDALDAAYRAYQQQTPKEPTP